MIILRILAVLLLAVASLVAQEQEQELSREEKIQRIQELSFRCGEKFITLMDIGTSVITTIPKESIRKVLRANNEVIFVLFQDPFTSEMDSISISEPIRLKVVECLD